ncbi:putative Beta-4C adrenergic receptor [Hypsibius exemplaris]|uniref:Beta-4C adrenergic receptor n=1 Tax=Hypsibius exemplaris TaxID=2072580 RepID=A0A1W0X411_HYPEX|nr:putative Beta-4C adrenergic receptor [Hypsibius exemplaris]
MEDYHHHNFDPLQYPPFNHSLTSNRTTHFLSEVFVDDWAEGSLAKAVTVSIITCIIILFNVLIIGTLSSSVHAHSMIGYFMLSLAGADLLTGVLLTPISIYPALTGSWPYGRALCKLTAYLEVTLWAVVVYTVGWMAVDRYLAIRKPSRYDAIQTKIRCQCWVVFTWVTAIFLCSPTLFAHNRVTYIAQVNLCILDLNYMLAYSITLLILILGPTICTLIYCYYHVWKTMSELKRDIKEQEKEALTSTTENLKNPTHRLSFIIIVTFALGWFPWFILLTYEKAAHTTANVPYLHFACLWFGICGCCWKFPIYCCISRRFRRCLGHFFRSLCVKCRARKHVEDDSASVD